MKRNKSGRKVKLSPSSLLPSVKQQNQPTRSFRRRQKSKSFHPATTIMSLDGMRMKPEKGYDGYATTFEHRQNRRRNTKGQNTTCTPSRKTACNAAKRITKFLTLGSRETNSDVLGL